MRVAGLEVGLGDNQLKELRTLVDGMGPTAIGYWPGGQLASEGGPGATDTVTLGYIIRLRNPATPAASGLLLSKTPGLA